MDKQQVALFFLLNVIKPLQKKGEVLIHGGVSLLFRSYMAFMFICCPNSRNVSFPLQSHALCCFCLSEVVVMVSKRQRKFLFSVSIRLICIDIPSLTFFFPDFLEFPSHCFHLKCA